MRNILIGSLATVLLAAGCGAIRSQALLATLPTRAAGASFDTSRVIDDSFRSGYPIDEILEKLGKSRSDTTVVDRYSSDANAEIGAFVVDGVSADVLLDIVVQTWEAPAVVARTQTIIGDRGVWALEMRPGHFFLAYRRASTIYWAGSDNLSFAEQLVAAMP